MQSFITLWSAQRNPALLQTPCKEYNAAVPPEGLRYNSGRPTVGGTKVGREAYDTAVDYLLQVTPKWDGRPAIQQWTTFCRWHQSGTGGLRYNSRLPTVGETKVGREAYSAIVGYLACCNINVTPYQSEPGSLRRIQQRATYCTWHQWRQKRGLRYNIGLLIVRDTKEGPKESYDKRRATYCTWHQRRPKRGLQYSSRLLTVRDTKEGQKEAYDTTAGYLLYVTPKCDTLIAASVMAALVMFSKSD